LAVSPQRVGYRAKRDQTHPTANQLPSLLVVIPEGNLRLQSLHYEENCPDENIVISTKAVHSLIVNNVVERLPHLVSAAA